MHDLAPPTGTHADQYSCLGSYALESDIDSRYMAKKAKAPGNEYRGEVLLMGQFADGSVVLHTYIMYIYISQTEMPMRDDLQTAHHAALQLICMWL